MFGKVTQCLLSVIVVCTVAFEEFFYVFAQVSQEMMEKGRNQYQILHERGNLPQYGPCWRAALDHVEDGCRALTDEIQGDMALHLTNCFLEMSGHETYNCELNKKPNLKAICINSMSDRAFNVYTEFYTHTQNICWFLRGQLWHETIAENTLKVGKQLKSSAKNQEKILQSQEQSLELQEKLLNYGKSLEKIMEEFYISTKEHQEVLKLMTGSLNDLQSWLLGEVSWFNSIMFYIFALILIFVFTSTFRTAGARIPILFLLFLNIFLERTITRNMSSFIIDKDIHVVHKNINWYTWTFRYVLIVISFLIIIYKALTYKDLNYQNFLLLQEIREQNLSFLEISNRNKNIDIINESFTKLNEKNKSFESGKSSETLNNKLFNIHKIEVGNKNINNQTKNLRNCLVETRNNLRGNSPVVRVQGRYNLRAKTETPEKNL